MTDVLAPELEGSDDIPNRPVTTAVGGNVCQRCGHEQVDHEIDAIVGMEIRYGGCQECSCPEFA